jgi:hypothetical protein
VSGTAFIYGIAALTWAAVAYKLPALRRRPRDRSLRAYWTTLLFLGLAVTALLPPVYLALGRLTGVPNLARLLGNGLVMVACWSLRAFLLHLALPPEASRRAIARAGLALVAMLALLAFFFALAPLGEAAPTDFTGRYADAPFILPYRLVFLAYLGATAVAVSRLTWRYAGLADRGALRLGLRLVAVGAGAGLAYIAHETLRVVAASAGLPYPVPAPDTVTQVLMTAAAALMVVGSTLPSWGWRAGAATPAAWWARYRAYRRLGPLWRAVAPDAAGGPTDALGDAWTLRDLRFRLYRRVVEIRDGWAALGPYQSPRAAACARALCRRAGLSGEEVAPIVDAAVLAAALRARARGEAPAGGGAPPAGGGTSLTSEVRYLERVAHHLRHSPVVRGTIEALERQDARR